MGIPRVLIKDGDETNGTFGPVTDPQDADSDDDGLSDYDEIFVYKTDPNDPDTDDDALTDGLEVGRTFGVWTANVANGENQNLFPLKNGNFENGTASWNIGQNHALSSNIQDAHTGFNSLKATSSGTTAQYTITVTAQRTYRLSGYMKKADLTDTAKV